MKFLYGFLLVVAGISLYVLIDNRNQSKMTFRQKLIRTFYPVLERLSGKNVQENKQIVQPPHSIYDMSITLTDGQTIKLDSFRGKKILIVNTASGCGYTPQYEKLEALYRQHQDSLVIIAFPSNDFKQQEPGTNEDIAAFCKKNFGVTFPIAQKGTVKKGLHQQGLYKWLTDPSQNGWNNRAPDWNFCKYLISENGVLLRVMNAGVTGKALIAAP
ncbi:MAG: glutathione peroxidase [Ferruginibacter sp.]